MASQRTKRGFTRTREGLIPHYHHISGICMPVKCVFDRPGLPKPKREPDGRLVYVQPNGEEFVEESDSDLARLMRGGA